MKELITLSAFLHEANIRSGESADSDGAYNILLNTDKYGTFDLWHADRLIRCGVTAKELETFFAINLSQPFKYAGVEVVAAE